MQLSSEQFKTVIHSLQDVLNAAAKLELAERVHVNGPVPGKYDSALNFADENDFNNRKRCIATNVLPDAKIELYKTIQTYHTLLAAMYHPQPIPKLYLDTLKNIRLIGMNVSIHDEKTHKRHASDEKYELNMQLDITPVITQLNRDAHQHFSLESGEYRLWSDLQSIDFPHIPKRDSEYWLNYVLKEIDTILCRLGIVKEPVIAPFIRGFFCEKSSDYCNREINNTKKDASIGDCIETLPSTTYISSYLGKP